MSQNSDMDTLNEQLIDNQSQIETNIMDQTQTNPQPPISQDEYYTRAQYNIQNLTIRNQQKLIFETLATQNEVGHKFIQHLYKQLEQHLENIDQQTSRKRRNSEATDDLRDQDSGKIQATTTQDNTTNEPSQDTGKQQVSLARQPLFPPRSQPNNPQPIVHPSTSNDPPNPFPGSTNQIKVPPITVINPKTYHAINELAKNGKFKISHAKTERNDAIKIFPATIEDYREITKTLELNDQEFVCRNIDEEKLLKVVLRNVPKFADVPEIIQELQDQGHQIIKGDRMYKKHPDGSRTPYSLVLLQLPHNEKSKSIYNIKYVCGFAITVEPKRTTMTAMQCHNCQQFGHNQSSCRITPRCHRCAEAHHYTACKKPITMPARCCNCGGNHPANYSGCPKFPKIPNPINRPHIPQPINHPSHAQPGTSYAQSLSGPTHPLISAINQLQNVLTAFLTSPSLPTL